MEAHSPVIAKKLWNVLRITFFMIRKGLVSKRKLIMDMNLMMKKGKLLRKSMSNFMSSHHHHHYSKSLARGYGMQEYEFSCSNSPNPVFFHVPKRKHHFNFPCMNTPEVVEEPNNRPVVLVPNNMTPEYTFNLRFDNINASDFAPGERKSPLLSSSSPFSVRISNYSSEDEENEEQEGGNGNGHVDDQAEDFIRRFYEQLRMQSRMQLLEYQEM
ncbi:hypothetical protein AAZX31_02G064100 [Glycine max]|uniref:DUF761 domain-containing protein n=3 Tax=Glycine subgen. Soja TaxID=1462606 RepID=I1JD16_SOYBN|nr:uncharacterized protein LOC100780921 [Glycine max]XP_028198587.1 uncharacterized protein LOC114383173 [Glycine soja]KAG5051035.1 hypothetical protein JHK87_003233 [Glycine soja]KAG5062365.1 hypothetical protein JHK85_003548 [Glycine max]KAG5079313.1 hypothetical protein JHK86_003378 [Glycine max]KAH1059089.1 hypothetical protein GYH30_003239 [Glycine max]KAH1260476.1 hypothetical protein GmHk_02G003591 [Glycine max]|eukprot:XP_003518159.1 uncharacterized protein LOC100780921 [Glycine max]